MIAVDSSAVVSIIKGEPERPRFSEVIASTPSVMSASSLLEIKTALSSALPVDEIDALVSDLLRPGRIRLVDFTPAMADAAVAAFRAYGKGRGHPAQLNFGDCMAYGTAKVLGVPLLYKGGDFAQTDIRPALA